MLSLQWVTVVQNICPTDGLGCFLAGPARITVEVSHFFAQPCFFVVVGRLRPPIVHQESGLRL